jgi:hypothetical protein
MAQYSLCATIPASSGNLKIIQTRVGNVFVEGQAVRFQILSSQTIVTWTVTDFWGKTVKSGSTLIKSGTGDLRLILSSRGYFVLTVTDSTATVQTSLAVLTPFDLTAVSDSPFGIGTHFSQGYPGDTVNLIALGGIKTIRDELYWSNVETQTGVYDFSPYWYVTSASQAGIKPMICLDYGNPLYDGGNAPYSVEGIQAYANYGRAVATTFGDKLEAVEVWNEYNCGFNTGTTGNRTDIYYSMLKTAYETIKVARPETKVVGVAMSCLTWDWLTQLFQLGSLNYMDAVSVHPYRWNEWGTRPPETLDADMVQLTNLISSYNATGTSKPAWSTEVSWPSVTEYNISPEKQADYIVRTYAVLLGQNIEKIYWYKLVCDLDDGMESQFGIIRHWDDPCGMLTPKPAYVALAVMARQLTGWTFVSRDQINSAIWSLQFTKNGETLRVLWATAPSKLTIYSSQSLTLTDMMGNVQTLQPEYGEVQLNLTDTPVYLKGSVSQLHSGLVVMTSALNETECGYFMRNQLNSPGVSYYWGGGKTTESAAGSVVWQSDSSGGYDYRAWFRFGLPQGYNVDNISKVTIRLSAVWNLWVGYDVGLLYSQCQDGFDNYPAGVNVPVHPAYRPTTNYTDYLLATGGFSTSTPVTFTVDVTDVIKSAYQRGDNWAWFTIYSKTQSTDSSHNLWQSRWATRFYTDSNCQAKLILDMTGHLGDANFDGAVDVGDLGILAANYGATSGKTWAQGDFNGDGAVDVGDLGILAAHYGQGSNTTLDFSADYAKALGTSVKAFEDTDVDSDSADDMSSLLCSGLGLSLIAGLALMGLMIVKFDE